MFKIWISNIYRNIKEIKYLLPRFSVLIKIKKEFNIKKIKSDQCILVDGSWDNPNFWLRLSIFLKGYGYNDFYKIGLTNKFNRYLGFCTFKMLSFNEVLFWPALHKRYDNNKIFADKLLKKISYDPKKLLNEKLPYDHPIIDYYDCLLKIQRVTTPNLISRDAVDILADLLDDLDMFNNLLSKKRPKLIILSHSSSQAVNYGTIVTIAKILKIPMVRISGFNGSLRFFRFDNYFETFDCLGGLSQKQIKNLNIQKKIQLGNLGKKYIDSRTKGYVNDIASKMAYQKINISKKNPIHKGLINNSWKVKKPIIAVYAQVWIDNPHVFGLNNFDDSFDWLSSTFETAKNIKNVNWIFRPHPWEMVHGRPYLKDLFKDNIPDHINILNHGINGVDVLNVADGLITISGTAGIEYSSLGKAVILADTGWYHKAGFGTWTKTRKEYFNLLKTKWWERNISKNEINNANIFAGSYFSSNSNDKNYYYQEDFHQSKIWKEIPSFLDKNKKNIYQEIINLNKWKRAEEKNYHRFKVINSKTFNIYGY